MTSLALAFDILANSDKARREFEQTGDSAARMGRRVAKAGDDGGSRLGKGISSGVKLAVGALAGLGLARMFTDFVSDAAEAAKIGRLTDAVIKSTGGSAKISSKQVADLAEALSNKTAVDDEVIQSGANLLLTFTKVRNEAGKGNDIFNQAARSALDMSVAMGSDLQTATIQLGKALNDPIKGVTALSKAGVQFTQQQKDQIKAMVEAGDTLGAQKIILGEMQTQFGGAAQAAADPIQRLKVVAGNLGEQVGGILLPHVERFATFVADKAAPAVERFLTGMQTGEGAGGGFAAFITGARDVADDFVTWIEEHKTEIKNFSVDAGVAILTVGQGFLEFAAVALDALALLARGLGEYAAFSYRWAGKQVAIMEAAVGWMPGWRGAFDQAKAMLDAMAFVTDEKAAAIADDLHGAADGARTAADSVGGLRDKLAGLRTPPPIHVDVDTMAAYHKVNELIRYIGRANSSLSVNVRQLDGKLHAGGPADAFGRYLVGERGPEILTMGSKSGYVHSNADSKRMVAEGAEGGARLHPDDIRALAAALRDGADARVLAIAGSVGSASTKGRSVL